MIPNVLLMCIPKSVDNDFSKNVLVSLEPGGDEIVFSLRVFLSSGVIDRSTFSPASILFPSRSTNKKDVHIISEVKPNTIIFDYTRFKNSDIFHEEKCNLIEIGILYYHNQYFVPSNWTEK